MRDLTRLLYILNKKPEAVRIPPDGIPLLDWSEQILNRYLTAQVSLFTCKISTLFSLCVAYSIMTSFG